MTISLGEERGTQFSAPTHSLQVALESAPGRGGLRAVFSRGSGDVLTEPGPAELRVQIPVEVIAAGWHSLDRLIEASTEGALPDEVTRLVVAAFQADLAARLSESLFAREVRWAGVVVSAVALVTRRRPTPEQLNDARRAQVARMVEQHCQDVALTPDTIARALGVSRRTLYLLTAHLGGVAEYVRRIRALRALELLQDPDCDLTLPAIAQASGFPSAKAMSRAVVRLVGHSPAHLRHAEH